jgi:hypothetical protein
VPASAGSSAGDLAAGLAGAAVVLLAVLLLLVAVLIRRYRSECHQLRARNIQLSIENDSWHEDFAAQSGELMALRRARSDCGYRARRHAEV